MTLLQIRLLRETLLKAGRFCRYCGRTLGHKSATLDHVLPESRGGLTTPDNLTLACVFCNQSKADRTPEEWAAGILAAVEGGAR